MWTRDPVKKSLKLEHKGDRLSARNKYSKALKAYERALEYDPTNTALIDKLVETHELATTEWDVEDFTKQMGWTMQKQEIENPQIGRVHEKLTPEFETISQLIIHLLEAPTEELEETQVDKIIAHGPLAVLPLIEFIRALKQQKDSEPEGD